MLGTTAGVIAVSLAVSYGAKYLKDRAGSKVCSEDECTVHVTPSDPVP